MEQEIIKSIKTLLSYGRVWSNLKDVKIDNLYFMSDTSYPVYCAFEAIEPSNTFNYDGTIIKISGIKDTFLFIFDSTAYLSFETHVQEWDYLDES